jgi:hypothetical protein
VGTGPTIDLLLLAGPGAPGARELLDRAAAAAAGGRLRVLLAGDGLDWAGGEALADLAARPATEVSLCSRSARDRHLRPEASPPWLRWSSLVGWLAAAEPGGTLWGALP